VRKTGVYAITILAILISSTLIQWTALSTPTLIQPQAATDVDCWEGKRCIDSSYYDCVYRCYVEAGYYSTDCGECAVLLLSFVALGIGGIYALYTGSKLIGTVVVVGEVATNIYLSFKEPCTLCIEHINEAMDCIKQNCNCPQWVDVTICP